MNPERTKLRQYPVYKPSGVLWLGDVPAHWEVRRLKHWVGINESVLPETTASGFEFRYLEISAVGTGRLVEEPSGIRFGDAPSRARRIVSDGDTIISTVRTYLKAGWFAEKTNGDLICSTGFAVLTPKRETIPRFVGYVVQSDGFTDQVSAKSIGIAYPAIAESQFSCLQVCVPPPDEQRAIVRYLDHADELINRYISAKERLIALMEERRQAVINQAVTRGLNPNVPMEPAKISWLEETPKHWDVQRLGQLATKFGSGVTPRGGAAVYRETGVPFLRSQNVHFDGLRLDDVVRIPPDLHKSMSTSHVQPHDILLNITGASIGRVCSVPHDFDQGNVNQHVCIIRPNQEHLLSRFLAGVLSTPGAQSEIRAEQTGASREGLTLQSIRDFRIPLPRICEQRQIINKIDEATNATYHAIATTRRQIHLIHEYRSRLIADAVTGQIDVRHAPVELQTEAR